MSVEVLRFSNLQQPSAASYSAGSNDDFALIEDEGDLPF